jgi:uncharacterized protein YbjT (DUF2867 family)
MPAIVVGADTPLGREIVPMLVSRGGEVRAFVSRRTAGDELRRVGAKVAVGDLSDGSHIAAAAYQAFTAVLVESALTDGRELAFAEAKAVPTVWRDAIREAGVQRAIWIDHSANLDVAGSAPEVRHVETAGKNYREVAGHVADLNDIRHLSPET